MNLHPKNDSVFSVATLLYARLRKVNSRVIDVAYLMHDRHYAQHIMSLALETKDHELAGYVERLRVALGLSDEDDSINVPSIQAQKTVSAPEGHVSFSLF